MGRYDDLMSLSLRRGFLLPSAEIYGGFAGFYDYGHNGARMRRNWEDLWIRFFLGLGDNYHLIDTATVVPYEVLEASGHVELFTDLLVPCTACGEAHKADALIEAATGTSGEGLTAEEVQARIQAEHVRCPRCGGVLGAPTPFHIMFPVKAGPKGEDRAFLRPETAQGAYLDFRREFELLRKRLPVGLAMVGKAYRNEISPRQGTFRMREFHQAELQIFFDPDRFEETLDFDAVADVPLRVLRADDRTAVTPVPASELAEPAALPPFYVYHLAQVQTFYLDALQVPPERFRLYELREEERAFYNRIHFDVQVDMDSLGGFKEVGGVHYRTDYDLKRHEAHSRQKMEVFFQGNRLVPHVLELSFGIDRNVWALLDLGYESGDRDLLRLPPAVAPIDAAVFPLVNKDGLPDLARRVYDDLRTSLHVRYDSSGSIGKRYARMDEVGTPFCLTVDYDSLEQEDVTVRDRDTTDQVRVGLPVLRETLRDLLEGRSLWEDLATAP